MKVFILCSAFCWFCLFPAGGQTPRAYETAAMTAFDSRDYYAAMKYYEQVLSIEPDRIDITYRMADAARLFGALTLAERSYETVLNSSKSSDYGQAIYWLANVKKTLGQYDQAINWYQRFLALPSADAQLRAQAADETDICEWALEQINHPDITVLIERLPEGLNTGYSEFAAQKRGSTLYYSSFRDIDWKDRHNPPRPILKIMQQEDGKPPAPAPFFNDPQRHTAHLTLSQDGRFAVFNHCDYTGETDVRCGLFFSKMTDQGWSEPQPLPEQVNLSGFTATEPNLSPEADGVFTLYFVSDRPGGKGGLDIWSTRLTADGNCSEPIDLDGVNTPEDDVTPYYFAPEKSLYFSSNGWPTLGGFDVYRSEQLGAGWSEPRHLPIPVNSSFNDLYYAPQGDDWAYLASNRIGSSNIDEAACCLDLYKCTILPLNLEATACAGPTGESLDDVQFTLVRAGHEPQSGVSAGGNQARWEVQRDMDYTLVASKEGYRPDTVRMNTGILPQDRHFVKKLYLQPDIRLAVNAFNQLSEEQLEGVKIRVFEKSNGGTKITEQKAADDGAIPLDARKQYLVVAEKNGYYADTLAVTPEELASARAGSRLSKNFFLTPATLSDYLPLSLYFDNDQPKPGQHMPSYDAAYSEYVAQRDAFVTSFTAAMSPAEKDSAAVRLARFFEEDVKGGFMKLEYFAENLDLFLNNQYQVTIMVKGFASPLANSDYNLALTRRRIASVLSYFRKYNNGVYASYIQSEQLKVMTAPLGEQEANPGISDDRHNRRLSVYSVEASRERRTEIIEVKLTKN